MVMTYWQCRSQADWTGTDCEELPPAKQRNVAFTAGHIQLDWTPKIQIVQVSSFSLSWIARDKNDREGKNKVVTPILDVDHRVTPLHHSLSPRETEKSFENGIFKICDGLILFSKIDFNVNMLKTALPSASV